MSSSSAPARSSNAPLLNPFDNYCPDSPDGPNRTVQLPSDLSLADTAGIARFATAADLAHAHFAAKAEHHQRNQQIVEAVLARVDLDVHQNVLSVMTEIQVQLAAMESAEPSLSSNGTSPPRSVDARAAATPERKASLITRQLKPGDAAKSVHAIMDELSSHARGLSHADADADADSPFDVESFQPLSTPPLKAKRTSTIN